MQPFNESEYKVRIDRIKKKMESAGIDVLLSAEPSNIYYIIGYSLHTYGGLQLAIVDSQDNSAHWFGRFMDEKGAGLVTGFDANHIHIYTDVNAPNRQAIDVIVDLAKKNKWENKRIGVEEGSSYLPPRVLNVLKAGLPNATFVDATRLVNWVRTTKSEAELKYVREAAILTDLGMSAGLSGVRVGRRQNEVAADILYAMTKGTEHFGGHAIQPMLMPAGRLFSGTYHASWSDEAYQAQSAAGLEFSSSRYHYVAPLARTVYLGTPPQKFLDKSKIMIEGLEAMLAGLKAGMTAEEGERLWRDSAIARGVDKNARIGYSVGVMFPPNWGEGTFGVGRGDTTVLQPNMLIHLLPSLMEDDWGLEISETVIIGENGCEPLSKLPRAVTVKK